MFCLEDYEKALLPYKDDERAFWKFFKEYVSSCTKQESFFRICADTLQTEGGAINMKKLFRLALHTNLTFLMTPWRRRNMKLFFRDNDVKIARYYRRKLKSYRSRCHLLRLKSAAKPFQLEFLAHRSIFKAMIQYGHEDFVFNDLFPYAEYIKGSSTASMLVVQRLYDNVKMDDSFSLENLEQFQQKARPVLNLVSFSSGTKYVKLDIFFRIMTGDFSATQAFVSQESIMFTEPVLNILVSVIIQRIENDDDFFNTFADPSYVFTRIYLLNVLIWPRIASERCVQLRKELFDFKHCKIGDSNLLYSLLCLLPDHHDESFLKNFIENSPPIVYAEFAGRFTNLNFHSMKLMSTSRAHALMESGCMFNNDLNDRIGLHYAGWMFPNSNDSGVVLLAKQHLCKRPDLRLLHKLLAPENEANQTKQIRAFLHHCCWIIKRRFGMKLEWELAFNSEDKEETVSPFKTHMCSLLGYNPDLVDCPKNRASFLHDYLLIPFPMMESNKSMPVIDMPIHLFESYEEMLPLLMDSMGLPMSSKLELIIEMCQRFINFPRRYWT